MSGSLTKAVLAALGVALAVHAAPALGQGAVRTLTLDSGLDAAAAGALDPGEARLPPGLWLGVDRPDAARLVAGLPNAVSSTALTDVAHRVLAVAAVPPRGPKVVPGFATTRAQALMRLGRHDLAARLMAAVPKSERQESDDLLLLRASLLTDDRAGACAVARDQAGRAQSPEFLKVSTMCEALAGDRIRADFGAAMAAERDPDDLAYFELLDMMSGAADGPGKAVKRLKRPTVLHRAMLRALNLPPPAAADDDDDFRLAIASHVAGDPAASLGDRVDAAWPALEAAAMEIDPARQLFLAAGASKAGDGAAGEIAGLLAQVAAAQPGQDRAVALARLLKKGEDIGAPNTIADLARPLLADQLALASGPEMAGRIARGLLLSGEIAKAKRWLASLEGARAVPGAQAAAIKLRALVALAEGADARPFEAPEAALWVNAVNETGGDAATKQTALMAKLRAALGLNIPPAMATAAGGVDPADVGPLRTAAAAGRVGETVLRAATLAGESGDDRAFRLAEATHALNTVGLRKEARAVAIDAAVAGGV